MASVARQSAVRHHAVDAGMVAAHMVSAATLIEPLDPFGVVSILVKILGKCQSAMANREYSRILQQRLEALKALIDAGKFKVDEAAKNSLESAFRRVEALLDQWQPTTKHQMKRFWRQVKGSWLADGYEQEFQQVIGLLDSAVGDFTAYSVVKGIHDLMHTIQHGVETDVKKLVAHAAREDPRLLERVLTVCGQTMVSVMQIQTTLKRIEHSVDVPRCLQVEMKQFVELLAAASRNVQQEPRPTSFNSLCLPAGSVVIEDENKPVGEGGFANVYKATYSYQMKGTNQTMVVAVKKARREAGECEEVRRELAKEAYLMSKLQEGCKQLVQYYGIVPEDNYQLVMEYMEKGSLHDYLREVKRKAGRSEADYFVQYTTERLQMALDAAIAVHYLHDKNSLGQVVHGDLKPGNFLVTTKPLRRQQRQEREAGRGKAICVKLSDFGCSVFRAAQNTVSLGIRTMEYASMSKRDMTVHYSAPEQLMELLHGAPPPRKPQQDIYSLGATLYEIFTCRMPFQDWADSPTQLYFLASAIADNTAALSFDPLEEAVPTKLVELIKNCMSRNPQKRPPAAHVEETLRRWLKEQEEQERDRLPDGGPDQTPVERHQNEQQTMCQLDESTAVACGSSADISEDDERAREDDTVAEFEGGSGSSGISDFEKARERDIVVEPEGGSGSSTEVDVNGTGEAAWTTGRGHDVNGGAGQDCSCSSGEDGGSSMMSQRSKRLSMNLDSAPCTASNGPVERKRQRKENRGKEKRGGQNSHKDDLFELILKIKAKVDQIDGNLKAVVRDMNEKHRCENVRLWDVLRQLAAEQPASQAMALQPQF